jgi:hypothetical protein
LNFDKHDLINFFKSLGDSFGAFVGASLAGIIEASGT